MGKMTEHRVLPLLAVLCLMLSGIHRMDAQQPEDSADLVFLIDASSNVGRTGFTRIRDFLVNYVERRLEVGTSRMQVGVAMFSEDVKIEFTLDEHTNKGDLINAMKNLRFYGGEEANMGAAVEYVVEQMFSSAAGSRREEGVPQSLVVITGGPSSDDLGEAANALKLNSIITFGIGIERGDINELKQIATDDSFVFTAPQFQAISQLENQIIPYIAGVAQRTIVLEPPTIITEVTEVNKRDIVFLIDSSSDLGGPSFSAIREFVVKVVNRLEIGLDLIRVGLAQYAKDVKPEFYLNNFDAKKDVIAHLKKMRILNTTPLNTGAALSNIQKNFFTASAGSRIDEGIPQILVVITGGRSRDDISQASLNLKRAGILTFTIGAKNAEEDELQEIAFDSSLVFKPAEFKQVPLQSILPQVLAPLRTLTGVVITEGPTQVLNQRDIVFLMDGSVNVGSSNFPYVRDFLINLINNLGISSEGTRVGLAQFSDTPRTEFYLNTLTSKSDLIERLGQLRIKGGNVLNIGSALQFVLRNHFTRSAGSRIDDKIPQMLVVLAAGASADNIRAAANDLIRSGVLTFCIAAGDADKEELETIAFNPSLVYEIGDFSSLPDFGQQLLTPITTYVRGEVTEVTVTEVEDAKKDVVFLIDGSDAAISGFSSLRTFVQRVVEYLNVGQDKVRIAVVQYSNSARPVFLLNAYSDKQEVIRAIQSMSPIGGSQLNTGAALDYVTRNVFTQSAGSRAEEGVPQFLLLLTTGKSRDDVRRSATSLKAAGVVPYAIGAGSADQTELRYISFTPDFAMYFSDVYQLENAYQTFSQRISTITTTELTNIARTVATETDSKRDILFLIDGSTNIAGRFPAIRDFVANIIDGFNVSPDGTRIALGLVGENVKVEFKFDSFQTKAEVVSAVRKLKFRPSKEFNLGVALDYAHGNLFTPESGSRIREGVPQNLVLLAAGKSGDSVDQAGNTLKRAGVVTFAIKAQRAESEELEKIVLAPQYILSSDSLTDLSTVQSQFVNLIKTIQVEVEVPTDTYDINNRKDIVFLVDGSNDGRATFPALRSFIQRVVENVDVGQDRVRIGVVQYSDATRPSFLLNAYPDRQGVLRAVQQLSPIGGASLNTGAALDYVTTNVFTRPAGSRSAEGVPQFLILLTTGRSKDDVRTPATELISSGVIPYAIGVRNADAEELRTISFIPDYAVFVPDASQLSSIYQTFTRRVTELKAGDIEIIKQSRPSVTYQDDINNRKDIVFLVDGSNDGRATFPALRSFIQRVVENVDVGQDRVRIGVVQYSDATRPNFLLNAYPDRQGVLRAVQQLSPIGGASLNTGAALDYVTTNVFTRPAGSRSAEGVPQFLILLTTGRSKDDVRTPATELISSGVIPYAIGVRNADAEELRTISFIPDYAVFVPDASQLSSIYQTFTRRVTELKAGDVEILKQSRPSVTYQGAKRDVVFLVDGSRGATADFNNIKGLIERIVATMDVSQDTTRIAVVQYSDDPKVEFLLNAHSTKDEVQSAVRRIRPKGGSSLNTGNALEYVSKNIFTRPSGSRIEEQVPQFLIVAASGPSSDDVGDGARTVKESSVVPFLIGKNIDSDEASKITFGQNFIYTVSSFQELPSVEQQLISSVTSLDQEKITELILRQSGVPSEPDPDRRDIVFLVDGSTRTGPDGIANIRDLILKLVQSLDVGPNKVRIGLVQFSDTPTTEFLLRSYMNKPALIQNIRRLRHKGGNTLNIGKALDFVTKNHFITSAGSRIEEGVPQYLVLLTGGKSEDDVAGAVRLLGTNRIRSLAVASGTADRDEVQRIVSDPRYLFTVREFRDLSSIENNLLRSFISPVDTTLPPLILPEQPGTGKKEADIVFLVDGSINLGRDSFKEVLQFVSGIVDAIVEENDAVQIGLAQYNSDVTDEFFLKEYRNRDEIMDAVTKAEYKGGRVANMGAAIRHLQDKHFVKPAGSRIDTGVPQIAFIVTGAKSVSDGQVAAQALASKGVKIFAIGVGSIDTDEVSKIASDAPSAFRVPVVQELSELNEQILITLETALQKRSVCPNVMDAVKDCNLEVILGFDVDISSGQNIFTTYRGLEPKLRQIMERISNMQKISCGGDKKPTVKVAMLSQGRTGPVEGFDFSEYRPELADKLLGMGTRGPYVLTGRTLQTYLNKFKTSGEDNSIKVIIHITDGVDASMDELQQASESLQNAGVKALLFVGMESAPRFDQIMQLEFGRGFTYNNPLRLNRVDLDYEIIEELDNVAEKGCCGVPCKCSGERGDVGQPGVTGTKGASGLKGHQGFPGEEGGPGERGPPGTNGTQGFRGCPGLRGFKGSRGFSGDKGEIGELGLDGIDGEDGKRGTPGSSGERGSGGPRGEKGLKGQGGERGDQGLRGDPGEPGTDSSQRGPRGPKGESGSLGEPGRDGPAGQAGGPGKTGPQGRRGAPGLKGNRGGPGLAGGNGEQGLRGPQGPPGQIGAPGTRGEQGVPGPRGGGGTPGPVGDRGRPGPLGRKGEPGDIGGNGSEGPVGPRGETGDDGRDGVGKTGLKGRKGETGFPGYPGSKGDPGDRGTNGDLGPKGSRGRRGNAGDPGTLGGPGEPGYPGPAGLKGERGGSRDHCGLVKHIKNTCPCCYGPKECPMYPTDLVFAIDASTDVNRNQFNNMKDAVVRMINQLTITDSNCPRGARVALLTYNSEVTTEVRFSEGLRKPALLNVTKDLQFKTNSKQRSLDTVMSFVARNTFKRARGGFLTRKVAVFFSNAPTRSSIQLNEAVLKLYDAGVASVFLTNREDRVLENALKVNNTDVGKAFVLGTGAGINDTISKVFTCHVCLDICDPASECQIDVPRGDLRLRRSAATDVDIDLAFLLDSSDSTNPSQFAEIKRFISHVIGQLELSSEPKSSSHHARIAVLQQAPYEHHTNASFPPVRLDIGLTDYTEKEKLQAFIQTKMTQLYGTRALSHAIKYVVENVFETVPNPRNMKGIFLILTGEVKSHELKQLQETIIEAKCKGYFFIILSIGNKVNSAQLNSLASEPHDVFSKRADKASELHEETLMRFGLHLPGFISSENAFHLSPEIRKHCDWFQNDRPASTSQDRTTYDETQNAEIPNEILTSKKPEVITARASTDSPTDRAVTTQMTAPPRTELLVSDVTDSSVYLSWTNADPQQPLVYELSITSLYDNSLVLKQNVTGSERLIGGLMSGQQYQVTITGQHKNLGLITYQETFTTSQSEPPTEFVVNAEKIVSTEPLDTPETDPCELDLDMGTQCKENEVKWFFDKTNKICTQVWYGGCGGNDNRFDTEAECINRCQKKSVEKSMQLSMLEPKALAVGPEACKLQKEEGTCREFLLKWYYDSETKSCARFWYGGCGGNENRFNTQKECEKICMSAPLNPGVVSAIGT